MKLQFSGFNKAKIEASCKAWLEDANDGLGFPPEIERHFKWVETHTEPSDVDSMAFGVFGENKNVALGICEITIQRKSVRSKWVKMLRLHLKPSVDEELQSGNSDLAMQVFTQCMIGTMDLQLAHKANTLKIYGRTPQQLAFLNRPLKKCSSNAPGSRISKKQVAQTRLRNECEGHFGLFAGRFARFGRTYPMAHA